MGRYIGISEFFGINSTLLSILQLALLVALVVCYLHLRKRLVKSGVLWRGVAVSMFEWQIGLVIFATLFISFTSRYAYPPVELTAINSEGSKTYSFSDISDFSAVVDGTGKYKVSIEMKDGNTVSLSLTDSEYNTLKKSFLESSGTGWMPKTVYILLSSLVGVVFCTIYLIVIYGRVIKQENTLYNAFKSSKHMSMLYLFLIVVAICIHSYLLSYAVV